MSFSLQAFAPAALLLVGGLWLLVRPGPGVFVLLQALALTALVRLAQLGTVVVTVPVYTPLPGIPLALHLDPLALFFAITAVVAVLLVSVPWLNDRARRLPYGWMALAEFGAVGAILAGDLPGMAAGWGTSVAALLFVVILPDPRARELRRPSVAVAGTLVLHLGAAAVLLAGAVGVEALAGTTSFDAIPVGALDTRTGLLLAAPPVLVLATLSGLVRTCRQPATAAVMLGGVLLPLAAYVLTRTFDLAGGRPLPPPISVALVVGGGLGATLLALHSLWAPDLGAAVARLLNALGLLLVAALGTAGPGGLVAFLVGFLSLELVAAATLGLLEAGAGRLPGRSSLPAWGSALLALIPLWALGGMGLGLGLDARLFMVRRLLDQGLAGRVLVVPVLAAVLLIAAGAFAAGRFGGGVLRGAREVAQLVLMAALLIGGQLASPVLVLRVAALAAAASRAPVADIRSTATATVPAAVPGVAITVVVLLLLVAAAALPRVYSATLGLRWAPDMLPPRSAVTPGIALGRGLALSARGALGLAHAAGRQQRWVLSLAWVLALVLVLLGSR